MLFPTFTTAIFASSFALTLAAPPPQTWQPSDDDCESHCMVARDANSAALNFQTLITNYSDTLAQSALATTFVDYSDSVTELINSGCAGPQPLGEPTFPSLDAFMKGQGSQPSIPFEILNVWYSCNTVTLRWKSAQSPQIITGIIVLETVFAPVHGDPFPWKISAVYSEFNSGAWLVNLGVFQPSNCSAAAAPAVSSAAPAASSSAPAAPSA